MKVLVRVLFCCVLATGLWAQRGGGARGGGGGGFRGGGGGGIGRGGGGFSHGGGMGGGFRGGGGFGGGGFGGGIRGGGGFNRGFGGGFRGFGGFNRGFGHGFGRGFGVGFYGGYWPYWGGYGFWDPYSAYGYGYPYDPYYSSYYSYPAYNSYYYSAPQQYVQPVPQQQPRSDTRDYRDEYGQSREVTYLIAFKDGVIRAAISYWADGNTLHYVTRDKQEHTVPVDSVDRDFSERLNRDQRVPFRLP